MSDIIAMFHFDMTKTYFWGPELQSDRPGGEYWSVCTDRRDFRNDAEFVAAIGRASECMGVRHTTIKPQLVGIDRHIAAD